MVPTPTHADVAPCAHGVHQPDRCPDRTAAPQPQGIADLLADQTSHAHPDLYAGEPRLVPKRLVGSVFRAEVHEVSLEVAAAPFARPDAKYVPDVGFGRR